MEIRALQADEIGMLEKYLEPLAEYHNQVAKTFSGVYPIVPIADALEDTEKSVREGTARAEVLFDDEGGIGGYCVAHFHGDTGDVDWVYIRDDLRGQGWGKVLMERALKYLEENGVKLVDMTVVRGNPAKEFYEGLGFEVRMAVMSKQL